MDRVRSEAERCDCLGALHVVHSVAGGTGSGLGCAITAEIADGLGGKSLVWNTCVSPFEGGEVIVQDYNAALTLAALQGVSDGVLVVENEEAERACKGLMKIDRPKISDLNTVIADSLSSFMSPSYVTLDDALAGARDGGLSELLRHMVPSPSRKIMGVSMVPIMPTASLEFTRDTWESGIVKRLRQMHRCGAGLECDVDWRAKEDVHRVVSNLLVLRGDGGLPRDREEARRRVGILDLGGGGEDRVVDGNDLPAPPPRRGLGTTPPPKAASSGKAPPTSDVWKVDCCEFLSADYVPWNPEPFAVRRSHQNFKRLEKMGTLLSNSDKCLKILERVTENAKSKFEARAYVHQFEAFGVGVPEFEEAFLTMDDVRVKYQQLDQRV